MATRRKRKQYSERDKAEGLAVLEANGGNVYKAAKELGINESTLRVWVNAREAYGETLKGLRESAQKKLSELLETEVRDILSAMTTARDNASYKELATAAGILIDKLQLLEGKATERVEHTLTDDERANRITAILDRGRERRTGSSDSQYVQ